MPLSRSISTPVRSLRQAAHHVQEPSTPGFYEVKSR